MPKATPFAIVRKVFSWFVLVVLILTLVLILKKSPAPSVTTSPAAAASAEQKLDAADRASASGQPTQVQLNSTELNSFLAQNLQLAGSSQPSVVPASTAGQPSRPTPPVADVAGADPQTVAEAESNVKDVKIDLEGDVVTAYVIFNVHGADLSLEISGQLYTQDGYMRFDPLDGKIGSFPLPQSALEDAVQRMMSSPENREKLRLPDNVSNIEVEDGQVVVSYK
ncbi:MAG TPA: hypothetical protein VNK23_02440 [Candidatus Dormibacteraeota bacterium]|nr:hypothetical protein [Candidatus Dormibacteraeota bacterium]